jgi:hypothetical protein
MVVNQKEPPPKKGGSALKGCLSYSTRLSNLPWTRGVPVFPTTGYGTTDFRATKCRRPFVALEKFVVKSEGTCVGRDPRRGKDSEWEWNFLPRDAGGPETRSVL